ncbi:50S ribosomal protein L21 [Candidatus Peregrinibacteria bacterium]|nr:50S ribosomal protein L21 [Candidatus Peregrinibacteria bacterium]
MFAIVEIAGFQEMAEKGARLRVPLIASGVGQNVAFGNVLLVADGADVRVGTPLVVGACVEAKILGHGRHDKVRVQKFKRRKRYRRVKGHRQDYTEVEVVKITA